jgi:hypothetical protein
MLTPLRRFLLPLAVGIGFAAVVGISLQAPRAGAQTNPFIMPPKKKINTPTPVIVELFTSEGCSSCPPADDLLADLIMNQPVKGARILALGIHVDYWDDLGWADRFSKPQFTDRQRAYAQSFGSRRIYTPQMIVDGVEEFVGSDRRKALSAIQKAAAEPHLPVSIRVDRSAQLGKAPDDGTRLVTVRVDSLESLKDRDADVVLAIAEERLASDVERGENTGRRLEHTSVVRSLDRVADSLGQDPSAEFATTLELDPAWDARRLSATVFVQRHADRRILGAAQTPLTLIAVPVSGS